MNIEYDEVIVLCIDGFHLGGSRRGGSGSSGDGNGKGGGLCMNIPSFKVHFHKTFMMKTDILGKPLAILHYV